MLKAFPQRTIVHVLAERVRSMPEKAWIVIDGASFTYAAVDALSNRVAHGLASAGLKAGDTLVAMLSDCIELVAVWIACAKLGAVEVPINTAYRGDILAHVVNDSTAETAIVGAQFLDRMQAIEGQLVGLKRCIVLGDYAVTSGKLDVASFETLRADDASPIGREVRESELKAIMYTSGTTGNSKGVMVSHAHAHEYASGCAAAVELGEEDVYYSAGLPLFHVAGKWGVLYAAAIHGATAVVPKRFSATEFWPDVRRHGATSTYLLGAMANLLYRQPESPDDADNPMRKMLMCPLLGETDRFARRFGLRVATAYGSTEVNAPTVMPLGTPVTNNQIVGKPRSDRFQVRILDEDDRAVPPGVTGEIAVRPKEPWITMLGYWKQPEATLRMWRNLWLHSGDAGHEDADGNIYFTDRIKDAIRRRGENISSMELEGIIGGHPAILECAAYPVASEFTEQEVMAAIVLKPGERLEQAELIRYLEPRMPYFMVPRYLTFLEELPRTPTGKVKKHLLRERGVTAATWDREAAGIKVSR